MPLAFPLSPGPHFGFARPGFEVRSSGSTFPHIKPWGAQRPTNVWPSEELFVLLFSN